MNDQAAQTPPSEAKASKQPREQSTIQFPYGDVDDAIAIATALMQCGGVPCDPDQLAGAMGQTPSSGAFRGKIATARIFGVIETVQNKYQLTDIGFAITDASRQKAAKADAFLHVPLYKKLYDTFRNQQLPPRPLALERTMVGFGVAQKQSDKARNAFDRSAQQAGFFDQGGRDRLIRPVGSVIQNGGSAPPESQGAEISSAPSSSNHVHHGGGHNGGHGGGRYHPFIEGLLSSLPADGTVWSVEGRAAWLEAAASVFKLLYQGDGRIKIAAEPER